MTSTLEVATTNLGSRGLKLMVPAPRPPRSVRHACAFKE